MKTPPNARELVLLSFALVALPVPLSAQGTSSTAAEETEEDVIVLSAFEVSETDSVGYTANSTLAGTRINTKLRDVGASISVFTPEFMADTGATGGWPASDAFCGQRSWREWRQFRRRWPEQRTRGPKRCAGKPAGQSTYPGHWPRCVEPRLFSHRPPTRILPAFPHQLCKTARSSTTAITSSRADPTRSSRASMRSTWH